MYSNFFNNKIFLFLIILLIGFLCIGSSFAVSADNYGNVNRDSNVHLNSVCDNDLIVSDVGGNVENIKNLTIQSPTISNKNEGSIGNSVDLKEIKGKTINDFNSSKINSPVHPIYNENDLKNALNLESPLIYLCANITLTEPIDVTSDVVIDGRGHTIKSTKPFSVGGAFQWHASKGIITNCIFENTSSTYYGGAIYICQGSCRIINCSFNDCHAKYKGGAIYIRWGNCSVVNCSFNDCHVDEYDLDFPSRGSGGAIYIDGKNCSVVNCVFSGCHTDKYGGAIYIDGKNCSVVNSSFSGCHGRNVAGAIYIDGKNCSVVNSSFSGCHGRNVAGAIFIIDKNCSVVNCVFSGCHADKCGGAIYAGKINSFVGSCSFVNCSANSGGAIYFDDVGFVDNCIFVNNTAIKEGKAVYLSSSKSIIRNSDFYSDSKDLIVLHFNQFIRLCRFLGLYSYNVNDIIKDCAFYYLCEYDG